MKSTRILFIGNSFTNRNDLPGMLARLAAAASPPQRVESDRVIANGRALKTHWERGVALAAIRSSKWNYVVLQEQSTLPLKNPARMHEYIKLFDKEIKASGAKTVLYMTWARRSEWDRQAELSEAYLSIGESIGGIVVPVGVAWQHLVSERPDFAVSIALFGGTCQLIITWLIHVTGNPMSPAWYLLAAIAVGQIAMQMFPESAPVFVSPARSTPYTAV